jgi:transcriptional regulator with XRE-family HTH domain
MVHIGKIIKAELKKKRFSVSEFAKIINTDRNNVYHIFKRKSIDTDLLYKISIALEYNFFLEYNPLNNQNILSKDDSKEISCGELKEWLVQQIKVLSKPKKK